MSDTLQPRASLWREGFRLFRRNWAEWSGWAVWFFVLMALLQALFMVHATNPVSMAVMQKITIAHQDEHATPMTPAEAIAMMGAMGGIFEYMIPLMIVLIVQNFAYRVFFMKKQPGIGTPKLSVGRFFYTVWIAILVFLINIIASAVLLGVPMGLGAALGKVSPFAMPAAIIGGLIGLGVFIFIIFRLLLTSTLAVCAAKPVIKNSWKLMKGNCWRVFGHWLLMAIIVLLLYLVVLLVELVVSMGIAMSAQAIFDHVAPNPDAMAHSFIKRFFVPDEGSIDEQIVIYIRIVFGSLNMCVVYGLFWAFFCAVTRVLYDEKRAADPTFKLVA